MKRLQQHLQEWVREGFILSSQAESIAAYEDNRPAGSWMRTSFMALGATVIGLGIISLVAANWYLISSQIKLGGDLLLLLALASGVLWTGERQTVWLREIFLILFLLACMASIGLIGQIYHASGHLPEAMLFWCLATLSAVLLSKESYLPFLWTTLFLGSLLFYSWERMLFYPHHSDFWRWLGLILLLPSFCAIFSHLLTRLRGPLSLIVALKGWTLISAGMGVFTIDLILSSSEQPTDSGWLVFLPGFIFGGILWLGIWMDKGIRALRKKLLLISWALYMISFPLGSMFLTSEYAGAGFTIAIMGSFAGAVGLAGQRSIFTYLILLMGLRFLGVYVTAVGGLALTGVGLIFSGLLILGIIYLWGKNRQKIVAWVEGLES
ncbi:MAG: DUF2157 domain-containing protein [Magnetococcus sp. DMHC-6]